MPQPASPGGSSTGEEPNEMAGSARPNGSCSVKNTHGENTSAGSLHRAVSRLDSLPILLSLPGLVFFLLFSRPVPAYPLRRDQATPSLNPYPTLPPGSALSLSLPDLY